MRSRGCGEGEDGMALAQDPAGLVDAHDESVDSGIIRARERGFKHRGAAGAIELSEARLGIVLVAMRGRLAASDVAPLIVELERRFQRSSRLRVFVDLQHVSSYDSTLRVELTRLLLEYEPILEEAVVLATNPMTRMAVAVASVAVSSLSSTTLAQEFHGRHQRALMSL